MTIGGPDPITAREANGEVSVTRDDLFPEIPFRRSGFLEVGAGHRLYWEESGNPAGIPVVFLHGGPGSGTSPAQRRFFDPAAYRIVLFDQRGAGRSTPHASVHANTTGHLVADMELLRRHLQIDSWLVFGGSWGSTLALAYGQAHPNHCLGFILRGIFLGRPSEVAWFLSGIRTVFPDAWGRFAEFLPPEERGDLLDGYLTRLLDPRPEVHLPAARRWGGYEAACSALVPDARQLAEIDNDHHSLALARIEAHYFANRLFLPPAGLLAGMDRLTRHPAIIVQGRYDVICPMVSADTLARAWRGAELVVVPDAGHAAMEPGIRRALVRATEQMKKVLAKPEAVALERVRPG